MEAPDLKPLLAALVGKRNIEVYNRTMATGLLTEDGRVVGATGLNTRTGEFLVFKANSTILSARARSTKEVFSLSYGHTWSLFRLYRRLGRVKIGQGRKVFLR